MSGSTEAAPRSDAGRTGGDPVPLPLDPPIWQRLFTVAPLVVVGTREPDGSDDLAPKHMAMPLGWDNWFCFACAPTHATQGNAERTGEFTVSYPRPRDIIEISLTAAPRSSDGAKDALDAVPTRSAREVDAPVLSNASVWLECKLDRVIEGFGRNSLIIGKIVAAQAVEEALRISDADDAQLIRDHSLLAYVNPGRFAELGETRSFPFHADMRI